MTAALKYLILKAGVRGYFFPLKMKPKTQKSLLSTWDKFKRNGDNTHEVKLFSFENIIEISCLISSECTRDVISS